MGPPRDFVRSPRFRPHCRAEPVRMIKPLPTAGPPNTLPRNASPVQAPWVNWTIQSWFQRSRSLRVFTCELPRSLRGPATLGAEHFLLPSGPRSPEGAALPCDLVCQASGPGSFCSKEQTNHGAKSRCLGRELRTWPEHFKKLFFLTSSCLLDGERIPGGD